MCGEAVTRNQTNTSLQMIRGGPATLVKFVHRFPAKVPFSKSALFRQTTLKAAALSLIGSFKQLPDFTHHGRTSGTIPISQSVSAGIQIRWERINADHFPSQLSPLVQLFLPPSEKPCAVTTQCLFCDYIVTIVVAPPTSRGAIAATSGRGRHGK
ncbi:hypothetical protein BaRGS_00037139 [Batillaria attramentaria]|uniref:Uncharacterized protein n=1 Tax=Batillaria attramentaria TaxID=370345 RepID=A0ABD0J9R1_9CAEN